MHAKGNRGSSGRPRALCLREPAWGVAVARESHHQALTAQGLSSFSVQGASIWCSGPLFLEDSGSNAGLTSHQPHDLGQVTSAPYATVSSSGRLAKDLGRGG